MESSRESLLFIVTIVTTVVIKQMIPSRDDYILIQCDVKRKMEKFAE
jgi:hypothetical protein